MGENTYSGSVIITEHTEMQFMHYHNLRSLQPPYSLASRALVAPLPILVFVKRRSKPNKDEL